MTRQNALIQLSATRGWNQLSTRTRSPKLTAWVQVRFHSLLRLKNFRQVVWVERNTTTHNPELQSSFSMPCGEMCRGGPASTGRSTVNEAHAEALGRLRRSTTRSLAKTCILDLRVLTRRCNRLFQPAYGKSTTLPAFAHRSSYSCCHLSTERFSRRSLSPPYGEEG
jgi:hypothetical protein